MSHLIQTVPALQHSLEVQSLQHLRLAELNALHLTALAQVLHLTLVRTARLGVCHCTAQPQRLQFLGLALLELDVVAFNLTRAPCAVTSGGRPSASRNVCAGSVMQLDAKPLSFSTPPSSSARLPSSAPPQPRGRLRLPSQ